MSGATAARAATTKGQVPTMTKKIAHDSHVSAASPADFVPDEDVLAEVLDALVRASATLALRPGLQPRARKASAVFWTVSTETLVKAADLATTHGVAEFDAAGALAAADYERRVAAVLAEARVFVQRLEDEMTVRHEPPARGVYALFAALKGLSRIRQDDRLAAATEELSLYLFPARRKKVAASRAAADGT